MFIVLLHIIVLVTEGTTKIKYKSNTKLLEKGLRLQ